MRSLQHSPDPSTAFFLYLDMLHRLSDQLAMPKFNSCLTPIYKTYVYHGVLTMWAPNSGFICHLGLTTPCSSNYTSPHTYTRTHTHTHTHTQTQTHTYACSWKGQNCKVTEESIDTTSFTINIFQTRLPPFPYTRKAL